MGMRYCQHPVARITKAERIHDELRLTVETCFQPRVLSWEARIGPEVLEQLRTLFAPLLGPPGKETLKVEDLQRAETAGGVLAGLEELFAPYNFAVDVKHGNSPRWVLVFEREGLSVPVFHFIFNGGSWTVSTVPNLRSISEGAPALFFVGESDEAVLGDLRRYMQYSEVKRMLEPFKKTWHR